MFANILLTANMSLPLRHVSLEVLKLNSWCSLNSIELRIKRSGMNFYFAIYNRFGIGLGNIILL